MSKLCNIEKNKCWKSIEKNIKYCKKKKGEEKCQISGIKKKEKFAKIWRKYWVVKK